MESGETIDDMEIDMSVSKDGGQTFCNPFRKHLRKLPKRRNKVIFWGQGAANELTCQFRFYGKYRFVVGDGLMSYYQ
jgi:hypothetical protein